MCALNAQPSKQPSSSPIYKEALRIKTHIGQLILKMQKDQLFTPTRAQLEDCAEEVLTMINKYGDLIGTYGSHLKSVIIDLSEVPVMSAQMQRLSFLTSLKEAQKELDIFITYL